MKLRTKARKLKHRPAPRPPECWSHRFSGPLPRQAVDWPKVIEDFNRASAIFRRGSEEFKKFGEVWADLAAASRLMPVDLAQSLRPAYLSTHLNVEAPLNEAPNQSAPDQGEDVRTEP